MKLNYFFNLDQFITNNILSASLKWSSLPKLSKFAQKFRSEINSYKFNQLQAKDFDGISRIVFVNLQLPIKNDIHENYWDFLVRITGWVPYMRMSVLFPVKGLLKELLLWCRGTQHNNTQHDDPKVNDNKQNNKIMQHPAKWHSG